MKITHVVVLQVCDHCGGKGAVQDPAHPEYGLLTCRVCKGCGGQERAVALADFVDLLRVELVCK